MTSAKLIYGLGIRQVGEKAAEVLARHFGTLDALSRRSDRGADREIPDVGEITAKCIVNYLDQPPGQGPDCPAEGRRGQYGQHRSEGG